MNLHFRTNTRSLQDDRFPTFDLREAVDLDTRETVMTLELPLAYRGYQDTVLMRSNYDAIERDAELVERLNLVDHFDGGFGSFWLAVVDDYTDEQAEELLELATWLREYGEPLDNDAYHDMLNEAELDEVEDLLNTLAQAEEWDGRLGDVTAADVVAAMGEVGVGLIEEQGGYFYIHHDDFGAAVEHALKAAA